MLNILKKLRVVCALCGHVHSFDRWVPIRESINRHCDPPGGWVERQTDMDYRGSPHFRQTICPTCAEEIPPKSDQQEIIYEDYVNPNSPKKKTCAKLQNWQTSWKQRDPVS